MIGNVTKEEQCGCNLHPHLAEASMLSEKKKEHFKKILTNMLDELVMKADRPASTLSVEKDASLDFADQASLESDLDIALHIKERESKLIAKVTDALERLEEGTFGICESCGEEISLKRLEARPVTTLCIECKKKQEASEKLRGI